MTFLNRAAAGQKLCPAIYHSTHHFVFGPEKHCCFPTFFIASVAESILLAIIMANCLLVFQSISLLELLTRLSNIQHFLKLEIPSNMWYSLVFVRVYRLFKLHFSDNLIRLLFKSYHS